MDAPNEYTQAGLFMLISGILNIMFGLFLALYGVLMCCATYGICFLCPLFGIIPLCVGIYEITVGVKVQKGECVPNVKTAALIGLVTGCICFNVISIIMEVLAVVNLGKDESIEYIESGY